MGSRWGLTVDCARPAELAEFWALALVDIKAGGRDMPWEQRWPRMLDKVAQLTAAGATVLVVHENDGRGDHVVLSDPEGNEFCVV